MKYEYKTSKTCSTKIEFELDGKIVKNVVFTNGCNGNLKAISKLVEGMEADKLIALLKGNTCRTSTTSCADQLARAVETALNNEKE